MTSPAPSKSGLVRTIRLDDARVAAILDRLDSPGDGPEGAPGNRRTSERYSYRVKGCIVHLQQPGASNSTPYVVATRDISAGGFSFLHGGFVHVGSKCQVQLITAHGGWQDVTGVVARCRYINDGLHEVGIRFQSGVKPADFCPAAVNCRVLLAEDDPAARRLGTFLLMQLDIEVDCAENGRVAIEKAQANTYDAILLDMDMPVLDGFGVVRELREKGYTGMIVATTNTTQPDDCERCVSAGCDDYIAKPLVREELAELLTVSRQEPLFSTFQGDFAMDRLINEFLAELPAKLRAIEEAFAAEDRQRLEGLARDLKGEAGGFGFDPITQEAEQVESALIGGSPLDAMTAHLRQLTNLCLRARQSAKQSVPGAASKVGDSGQRPAAAGLAEADPDAPDQRASAS